MKRKRCPFIVPEAAVGHEEFEESHKRSCSDSDISQEEEEDLELEEEEEDSNDEEQSNLSFVVDDDAPISSVHSTPTKDILRTQRIRRIRDSSSEYSGESEQEGGCAAQTPPTPPKELSYTSPILLASPPSLSTSPLPPPPKTPTFKARGRTKQPTTIQETPHTKHIKTNYYEDNNINNMSPPLSDDDEENPPINNTGNSFITPPTVSMAVLPSAPMKRKPAQPRKRKTLSEILPRLPSPSVKIVKAPLSCLKRTTVQKQPLKRKLVLPHEESSYDVITTNADCFRSNHLDAEIDARYYKESFHTLGGEFNNMNNRTLVPMQSLSAPPLNMYATINPGHVNGEWMMKITQFTRMFGQAVANELAAKFGENYHHRLAIEADYVHCFLTESLPVVLTANEEDIDDALRRAVDIIKTFISARFSYKAFQPYTLCRPHVTELYNCVQNMMAKCQPDSLPDFELVTLQTKQWLREEFKIYAAVCQPRGNLNPATITTSSSTTLPNITTAATTSTTTTSAPTSLLQAAKKPPAKPRQRKKKEEQQQPAAMEPGKEIHTLVKRAQNQQIKRTAKTAVGATALKVAQLVQTGGTTDLGLPCPKGCPSKLICKHVNNGVASKKAPNKTTTTINKSVAPLELHTDNHYETQDTSDSANSIKKIADPSLIPTVTRTTYNPKKKATGASVKAQQQQQQTSNEEEQDGENKIIKETTNGGGKRKRQQQVSTIEDNDENNNYRQGLGADAGETQQQRVQNQAVAKPKRARKSVAGTAGKNKPDAGAKRSRKVEQEASSPVVVPSSQPESDSDLDAKIESYSPTASTNVQSQPPPPTAPAQRMFINPMQILAGASKRKPTAVPVEENESVANNTPVPLTVPKKRRYTKKNAAAAAVVEQPAINNDTGAVDARANEEASYQMMLEETETATTALEGLYENGKEDDEEEEEAHATTATGTTGSITDLEKTINAVASAASLSAIDSSAEGSTNNNGSAGAIGNSNLPSNNVNAVPVFTDARKIVNILALLQKNK